MELVFAIAYSIVVPAICISLGYVLGKKRGYDLRAQQQTWEDLKMSLHVIQGLKQVRIDVPTLEEQLAKAIANEDYDLAAKIRDQLNKNKDDE
jgi:excinuclease UvrABC helicase subunit UvrB